MGKKQRLCLKRACLFKPPLAECRKTAALEHTGPYTAFQCRISVQWEGVPSASLMMAVSEKEK